MNPDDPVTITIKRKTAEAIRFMMPLPGLLRGNYIAAGVEFSEAVDKALGRDIGRDVHADMKEGDEEEPAYEPPR